MIDNLDNPKPTTQEFSQWYVWAQREVLPRELIDEWDRLTGRKQALLDELRELEAAIEDVHARFPSWAEVFVVMVMGRFDKTREDALALLDAQSTQSGPRATT